MRLLTISSLVRSAAIHRLELRKRSGSTSRGLAYFFCSFTDQQTQELHNILGSLLVQLCEVDHSLWIDIDDRYKKERGQSQQEPKKLGTQELADLIVQCAEYLSSAIIVLDALNEGKESSSLLQTLLKMSQKTMFLKILISSTEELGVNLGSLPVTLVTMEKDKTANDIRDYIEARLRQNNDFGDVPRSLKEEIKSKLQREADGTYDGCPF